MKILTKPIQGFLESYSLERLGHIYFWPDSDKAKFITDSTLALFLLGIIGTLVNLNIDFFRADYGVDNKVWIMRYCASFIVLFLLIRLLAVFSGDSPRLAKFALVSGMAGLSVCLPLLFSTMGIFDGFVWLILFIYVAVGFVVLHPAYIIATQLGTLLVLIFISFNHDLFPYKMRSYMVGEQSYIENFSTNELVFQWFLMSVMSLLGMTVLAYLTTVWQRREQNLRVVSTKDELTGLMNRRSVIQFLQLEMLNSAETGDPLSVCMIDLDHFKGINDNYGHPFGDKALKLVAAEAQKIIRRGDAVGRFGGEEFLMVFPNCHAQHAKNSVNRLREILSTKPLVSDKGEEVHIDLSAGVAEFSQAHHNHESLIKVSDDALYKAKEQGRGRVVLAE